MNIKIFCHCSLFPSWSAKDLSAPLLYCHLLYRGADKSLARRTSRCILFDGENILFDASLVIYINSTNIPTIMIINRIYQNQNLLSLQLVSFPVGLRTYQYPGIKFSTIHVPFKKFLHQLQQSLTTVGGLGQCPQQWKILLTYITVKVI